MTVAMIAGALLLLALGFTQNLTVYLVLMGLTSLFLGLGFQFGNIAVQGAVPLPDAGAAAGVLLTVMVSTGGVAVVAAAASIEALGSGGPDQYSMTVTYVMWAVLVGALGAAFGMWQWRRATLPEAAAQDAPAAPAPADPTGHSSHGDDVTVTDVVITDNAVVLDDHVDLSRPAVPPEGHQP